MSAVIPYEEFISRRKTRAHHVGRDVDAGQLHWSLKPFQADIVRWACKVGRPAVWADTGLGKTRMQLEWCRLMGERSLIITPLAVAEQTVEEAHAISTAARYVRSSADVSGSGVHVTSIEMVDRIDPNTFDAVALDEASILKNSDGKTRGKLISHFQEVPYRSAWTATPAPNDPEELTNQAEFLGHMARTNMLAAYFVHDQDGWRLKGHAYEPMLDWMSTWALAIRRPSDLGYPDDGYDLPGLDIIPEIVDVDIEPADGELFALAVGGVSDRARIRKETLERRVERAARLASDTDEQWLLWAGLNDEARLLEQLVPDSVNVHGSMSPEDKARHLLDFAHGHRRVLITKPKIAGMGLNFQRSARMAFVGINDSYEQYYQCLRRQYRYGQTRRVQAHIVVSEVERQIVANVQRKEQQANRVVDGLIRRLSSQGITA